MAAKRMLYVGNADDVRRTGGNPLWDDEPLSGYVEGEYSDDEWGSLLWRDVRAMYHVAKLTPCEVRTWQEHILGEANVRIAELQGVSEARVSAVIAEATAKVEAAKKRWTPLLTVVKEELGWSGVAEVLRNRPRRGRSAR